MEANAALDIVITQQNNDAKNAGKGRRVGRGG